MTLVGVSFIHNMKIIHRDLKPANIFLTSDKKLKIGDFGIAKTLDKTSGLASTYCGTAVYMAPEIHDKTVKYQGADADCFAFGVSLFVAKIIGYPWKVPDLIKDNDYKLLAGDYGINSEEFWRSENFSLKNDSGHSTL